MDSRLHFYLQNLPKESKLELLSSINKEPYTGQGSAAKNAKTIFEWLRKHNYTQPSKIDDNTLNHINTFISDTLYGEYFPERIPKDDNEELKQLEQMREAIDERIRELQQQEQIQKQIWEEQQQEQQQLFDNYNDLYINQLEEWNESQREQLNNRFDNINNLVQTLYDKPFGTTVDLKSLDINECEKLTLLLKKWYEDKIKNQELKDKIAIVLTVNNEQTYWP